MDTGFAPADIDTTKPHPAGGTVTVAVTAARGEVLVAVTDDGGPA